VKYLLKIVSFVFVFCSAFTYADTAPTVTGLTASSNSSGTVSGSFTTYHSSGKVKNLRVHYADNSSYNNSQTVTLGTYNSEQNDGYETFSFDASAWTGQTVYYKVEIKSPSGTSPSNTPESTVAIPAEDTAPTVTDLTASSNSSGTVSGSFTTYHSSGKVKNLRVHYADNSSYNNSQTVTLGTYNSEQNDGYETFSFDASAWAGQTVYYKVEIKSPSGTSPSNTPESTVAIPAEDTAPTVTDLTASSNSSGTVSGSFTTYHSSGKVKNLRVHYADNSSYNNSQTVTLGTYNSEQNDGYETFSFDASAWAGQTVYYKVEIKSPSGTSPSNTPESTVAIPAEDTAPTVTGLTATSNDSGLVNGSFSVAHSSNKVKNVRVHYADNANYTNSQSADIGSYSTEQSTGSKTFSFDASAWAGQTVYYKLEIKSPSGTSPSSTPESTVAIPAVNDTAPVVTGLTATSNDSGLVNGSFSVAHSSNKVKNVRVHYADNANYTNSQSADIGSYSTEQSTGSKTFSFDASAWAGQTVYYKLEIKSPSGTSPSNTPESTVAIPFINKPIEINYAALSQSSNSSELTVEFQVFDPEEENINVEVFLSSGSNVNNDFKTSSKKSLKSIQNGKHIVAYTLSDIESYGLNNSQTIVAKIIAHDNEALITSKNTNIIQINNSNEYCAEWVKDLTLDDTNGNIPQVEKSSPFIKGWRIKNCGSVVWSDNTQLIYNWGNVQLIETVTVNQTEVGQSVDVYATLQSPDELDTHDASFVFLADENIRFGELTLKIEVVESNNQADEIAELEELVKNAEAKANQNWSDANCPLVEGDSTYSAVDYDEYLGFRVTYRTQCDESITTIVSAFFADNAVQSRMLESQFFSDANKEKSALKFVVRNDIYNIVTRNKVSEDLIKATSEYLPSDVVNYLALHEQSWINYLKSENSDFKFTSFNGFRSHLVPEINSARYMKQFCIEILKHNNFKCHMSALTHTDNILNGLSIARQVDLHDKVIEIFPNWTDETISNYRWMLEGLELYKTGQQGWVQLLIQNEAYALDSAASIFTSTATYLIENSLETGSYLAVKISNSLYGQVIREMAKENWEYTKNSEIFIFILELELTQRGVNNAHQIAENIVSNLNNGVDAWKGLDPSIKRTIGASFTIATELTPVALGRVITRKVKKLEPDVFLLDDSIANKLSDSGNLGVDLFKGGRSSKFTLVPTDKIKAGDIDLYVTGQMTSDKAKGDLGEEAMNYIFSKSYDCIIIPITYKKGKGIDGLCVHGSLEFPTRVDILESKAKGFDQYGNSLIPSEKGVTLNASSNTTSKQMTDDWIKEVLERAAGFDSSNPPDYIENVATAANMLQLFQTKRSLFNKYVGVLYVSKDKIPVPVLELVKIE